MRARHWGWLGGWLAAAAALAALPACGYRFPVGEKLLPESYGPPFGAAITPNLPKHAHNPADEERFAAADDSESRIYRDHKACRAALLAAVKRHGGGDGDVKTISTIEAVAHVEAGAAEPVHEYRCSDYVLSYRAWCRASGHGGGAEDGQGKPEGGQGDAHKKPEEGCKASGDAH